MPVNAPPATTPGALAPSKVTVKTLARAVGVSPATVSNAYNRPDQLSEELRSRILAKADELGYSGPSAAGRSLRSGKANAFGVMFVGRLSYAFYDPFAALFLCGLAGAVEDSGTSISLLPVTGSSTDPDITSVRQANIDGLVVMCVTMEHPAVKLTRARGLPVVSSDMTDDPDDYWVAIDDEAAGYQIGRHLTDLGHTDITVVTGSAKPSSSPAGPADPSIFDEPDSKSRLDGLTRALNETSGGTVSIVAGGYNSVETGQVAGAYALDRTGPAGRPSAIVALSDVMALGVLDAARSRGLTPGLDISVAGFDDVPAAAAAGLTTIHQPIAEKGRRVGQMLLDPTVGPRQLLVPHELMIRSSTGPARV